MNIDEILAYDQTHVTIIQNGKATRYDNPYRPRETVEHLLEEKLGFSPPLQEAVEDGEYLIYLHTEAFEDLNQEELDILHDVGITEHGEETTKALKSLLNIDFKVHN